MFLPSFLANSSMFSSKLVFFAISLGAISVFATPHALNHHALHHRALAGRVTSISSDVALKRQADPNGNSRGQVIRYSRSSISPSFPTL